VAGKVEDGALTMIKEGALAGLKDKAKAKKKKKREPGVKSEARIPGHEYS